MDCKTMSVEEAAELLGFKRTQAYDAVHRGELPAIRLGRRYRIPLAVVEAMISLAVAAAQEPKF